MRTIIVYGGRGVGKTQYSEALARKYGCKVIEDSWYLGRGITPGALHLTSDSRVLQKPPKGAELIMFEEAIK